MLSRTPQLLAPRPALRGDWVVAGAEGARVRGCAQGLSTQRVCWVTPGVSSGWGEALEAAAGGAQHERGRAAVRSMRV